MSPIHSLYDTPEAVERYQRVFQKLIAQGSLSESGATQCAKLRERLLISEELHAQLMRDFLSPQAEIELEIAIAWRGDILLDCALIHRGDFTLELIELSVFVNHRDQLLRFEWHDLEPGDYAKFQIELWESSSTVDSIQLLAQAGVQIQVRALDITEERLLYRSSLFSVTRNHAELFDLEGQQGESLTELSEQRALKALLGALDWKSPRLRAISESSYFQWEVSVIRAQADRNVDSRETWRVGDQLHLELTSSELKERLCPNGISWIGAPLGVGRPWETPAHQVHISHRLWCSEHLITQALWSEIMGEPDLGSPQLPQGSVSWWEAVEFCNRLSVRLGLEPVYQWESQDTIQRDLSANGYRLPTEAEWEHLARAGLDRIYAGSNHREAVCWSIEDGKLEPQPVGIRQPNSWGLFDLSGNLWEWCEDLFIESVYRDRLGVTYDPRCWETSQETGLQLHRGDHQREAPRGEPHDPKTRVRRGGSIATPSPSCRIFSRADGAPHWRHALVGFRVVRSGECVVTPQDRARQRKCSSTSLQWIDLASKRIYLGRVKSSPYRKWQLRLTALQLEVVDDEEGAEVVILIPPRQARPSPKLLRALETIRRRAQGIGCLTLTTEQLELIIEEHTQELQGANRQISSDTQTSQCLTDLKSLQGSRVIFFGKFSVTQTYLKRRIRDQGVLRVTATPSLAQFIIRGMGTLSERQQSLLAQTKSDSIQLNEAELIALLDREDVSLRRLK